MAYEDTLEYENLAIETWKKSIEVQEHFNEICMKIRNFYISLITALFALIGVIISRSTDPHFTVGTLDIHIAIPILASIILATILFYFIDRHWYHRLLVGAVLNAIDIEKRLGDRIPGLNLATKIGERSPLTIGETGLKNRILFFIAKSLGSDKRIVTDRQIHSDAKISIFYKGVASVFFVILIITSIGGGIRFNYGSEPCEKTVNSVSEKEPSK